MQTASTVPPTFHALEWLLQSFVMIVPLGFPVALVIAWAFEMTPQGMKRTENVSPNEYIPQWSTRRFAFFVACVALLAAGLWSVQFARSRLALSHAAAGAATAPEKSIAVLPFEKSQ